MDHLRKALPLLVGLSIWLFGTPQGVQEKTWQLFAIFVATIAAVVLRPYPNAAVAVISLGVITATKTLTLEEGLSGFSHEIVWLIVFAYFVAFGFIKTGLGRRISYHIMTLFGKRSLGLGYSLAFADALLAPAIPSSAARAGGILYPILESLSLSFESKPHTASASKIGSYLTLVAFQSNTLAGALFLTAMAGNPIGVQIASEMGVPISWTSWFLFASLPCLVALFVTPLVIYKLAPPEIKKTPHAPEFAKEHLRIMGSMSYSEKMMLAIFALLIFLWAFGKGVGITATTTALIGLTLLLLTKIVSWKELLKEEGAWDTLIWFSILLMMATKLSQLGFTQWFGATVTSNLYGLDPNFAIAAAFLIYFYAHYFFASNTAHISALFSPFLAALFSLGADPLIATLLLLFFSNLFGGLTHYGSGPAAIYFGSGFTPLRTWWSVGFIMSLINIAIFTLIGIPWWRALSNTA